MTVIIHIIAGVRFGIKKLVDYRETRIQISQAPQVSIEMGEMNQRNVAGNHSVFVNSTQNVDLIDTAEVNTVNEPEPTQNVVVYNNTRYNVDISHIMASVTIFILFMLHVPYFLESLPSDWAPIIHCMSLFALLILLCPLVFWICHPDIYKFIVNSLFED